MSEDVYPYEGGRCPHGSTTLCPYCEPRRFKGGSAPSRQADLEVALAAGSSHLAAARREAAIARLGQPPPMTAASSPQTDLEVALGAFDRYVDTGDDCHLDNLNPEELRELAKRLGRQAREAKDPPLALAGRLGREDEFVKAHPRLHCPACRKRLSPAFDNIDAMSDRPQVRMRCRHCGHRFTVARSHR